MSVESKAAGLKNAAYGLAVLVAIAGVIYLVMKGRNVVKAAKDAGGFLFGADSAPETVGTWLYDALNSPPAANPDGKPAYWDYSQAEKTKIRLIGAREKTYGVD